jgi:HPt (histidine-containing phosphotransfer) domain-containing protein
MKKRGDFHSGSDMLHWLLQTRSVRAGERRGKIGEQVMSVSANMSTSGKPILDVDGALSRVEGDRELYEEILNIYVEDTPQQLSEIAQAFQRQDRKVVERAAHSLKSSSANVGAESVRAVALELESAAKIREWPELDELVAAIKREFDAVNKEISKRGLLGQNG